MNIAIIIPPSPSLMDDRVFPFLGPLQIASVARDRGHKVSVIDLSGYKLRHPNAPEPSYDQLLKESIDILKLSLDDVDVVGFYSLATQHAYVVALNRFVKSYTHAVTVLGGPRANTAPTECVKDGFDYVVVSDQGGGGGESGFLHVLDEVHRGVHTCIVVSVPSRSGVKWENDKWPLPARDLIDLKSYVYHIEGERATSLVSMSGCPFACVYCSHWCGYRKIEGKSSKRTCEEIKSIKREYGWRGLMFYDDEINLRPDFSSEFLPMLEKQDVVWRAFFKGGKNLTNEKIFESMRRSGCVQLCTGAESADPKILHDIKKQTTVEDNTNFVKYCVKHGIKPKVFTQVGLPGETHETVKALRDWLVAMAEIGLTDADVSITTPFEGAPMYETPDDYDIHFNKASLDFSKESVSYKTKPGEYRSHVWHDTMTQDDIVAARQWVEDEFRSAAGLPRLLTIG